jgi:hypothetical protein
VRVRLGAGRVRILERRVGGGRNAFPPPLRRSIDDGRWCSHKLSLAT